MQEDKLVGRFGTVVGRACCGAMGRFGWRHGASWGDLGRRVVVAPWGDLGRRVWCREGGSYEEQRVLPVVGLEIWGMNCG